MISKTPSCLVFADIQLSWDPAPPWSLPVIGPAALLAMTGGIIVFTLWTYRGAGVSGHRKAAVVAIRLIALLIALLTILRPSLAVSAEDKSPSTLIIVSDCSKSMTVADELDNKRRWDAMERVLKEGASVIRTLREEYNVTIVTHRFAEELYDEDHGPDGTRTDFGQMVHSVIQRFGQEPRLRGLLVLSDGADNGARYPAFAEAAKLRALNCPIETFAFGRESTSTQQRDLSISAVTIDPSPAPIKSKLAVRAVIDAHGLTDTQVPVRLYFDGNPVVAKTTTLSKEIGNEVVLETSAPTTPGEIKVTVKVDPRPGEASVINNELTTYLTVTKEGISVLVIDRLRLERTFLRRALAGDPRFRVVEVIRQTDDPIRGPAADLYNFDRQAYDVIVIGDVSARRLSGGDDTILAKIQDLVRNRGVGLIMLGGQDSFTAGGWGRKAIAEAFPVLFDAAGQIEEPVQLLPSPTARGDFMMRIANDPASSEALWRKLPPLPGYTLLGRRREGAVVVGQSAAGAPLLLRQNYGKGRAAALALDTTYLWQQYGQARQPRNNEGLDAHARFWRQMMLFLAQQEETEGSVWIKPDARRIAVGGRINFSVGARGKTGMDLPEGTFDVQVVGPNGPIAEPISIARIGDVNRGSILKTDQPGEYRIVAKGNAKDVDGSTVEGTASARFLAFQDDTELLRPAANHDFLRRLAQAGGGQFHQADELPEFLEKLPTAGTGQAPAKLKYIPDWRSAQLGWFQPLLFVMFVALLGCEWGLRRWWGMV